VRAVRILIAAAACLAGLVLVGSASALIVPQRSIARIELEMTRPEVRALKGDPLSVEHGSNKFGNYTIFKYGRLKVTFQGNQGATAVWTTRPGQRTSRDIGVGSTQAELRDAYPHANCRTETSTFRHCWTGRFEPGRRVTDYKIGISDHLVKSVLVAFVID
jgi:hypothetical protein